MTQFSPNVDATQIHSRRYLGFTLVELMLSVAVASIIATVALNGYESHIENAKIKASIGEMKRIEALLERHRSDRYEWPAALSEILQPVPKDPWGKDFQYLRLQPASKASKGKARKDHNLVPINSDYDLYSSGPDGKSVGPLTAKASRDDIVRGNNGGFVGSAAEY